MTMPPVRYTPTLENPKDGETQTIDSLNDDFDTIMQTTAEEGDHAIRAVHAKAHGIVEGVLTIEQNLAPELAQGLFAQSGDHKVYLRFSTNAGDYLDDSIALPRGLAIKVCDVEGERLPGAEGTTQDFVMLNAPAFAVADAATFEQSVKLLAKTTNRVEWLKKVAASMASITNKALGAVGVDPVPTLVLLGGMPNVEPLGESYYSATPFRYGEFVAKFRLRPLTDWQQALTGEEIDVDGRENAIREEVREEFGRADARWEFAVQLLRDTDKQPIEDASVEWPEDVSPFQPVGTLTVSAQDSWQDARVQQVNETMRFSPWTGLAAHQPLGNVNRARKETYRHSAQFRERVNGCPIHEPR